MILRGKRYKEKWFFIGILLILIFSIPLIALSATNLKTKHNVSTQANDRNILNGVQNVQGVKSSISATPVPVFPTNMLQQRKVYVGMWTQGFWDVATNTLEPGALLAIEQKLGKKMAIAHYYRGWQALESTQLLSELRIIDQNGWRPMVSANPYFFSKCEARGLPLYRAIAIGNCDEFLHAVGGNLKAFGKTMFLRFAWEMNIPSMEWEIRRTGSTNEDFVNAWRRIRTIVYEEGAANTLFVFSPHVTTSESVPVDQLYPGDEFVDWVGLDGYNWGTTQSWSNWQDFQSVFGSSYNELVALAPTKPMMIAEVNSTDRGGDKAGWYKDMLTKQIPGNFPSVKAIIFYNEDRMMQENVNWLFDVSPEAQSAFATGLEASLYTSSF